MIDLGISRLVLIDMVVLVVIGPERLPRVARAADALLGYAQRYIVDMKAEVNHEIKLEELRKIRTDFRQAARNVEQTIHQEVSKYATEIDGCLSEALGDPAQTSTSVPDWRPAPDKLHNGRNNWHNKQLSMSKWYRQKQGVHMRAQSGAARVRRRCPPTAAAQSCMRSFFE